MSPRDTPSFAWDDLPRLFPGLSDPERWLPLLRQHLSLVEQAAGHTRVTSVPAPDAIRRHYAESLELLRLALERMRGPRHVVDVGSGGGYPGMVIAAVLPRAEVALVEPLQKRARLLTSMAAELALPNVSVYASRAEDAGRSSLRDGAELVTARAVAHLAELVEYVAPFAAPGAIIALPKGSALDDEMAESGPALEALACQVIEAVPMRNAIAPAGRVLMVRKLAATPAPYPRRAGVPGRRPFKR